MSNSPIIIPTSKTSLAEFAVYIDNHRYTVSSKTPKLHGKCVEHERIVRAMNELQRVSIPAVISIHDTLMVEMAKLELTIRAWVINS